MRSRRSAARAAWDVVFLDPPFGDDGNEALFRQALAAAVPLLASHGCIYLEAPRPGATTSCRRWACAAAGAARPAWCITTCSNCQSDPDRPDPDMAARALL